LISTPPTGAKSEDAGSEQQRQSMNRIGEDEADQGARDRLPLWPAFIL
jgi:hypothetical protein